MPWVPQLKGKGVRHIREYTSRSEASLNDPSPTLTLLRDAMLAPSPELKQAASVSLNILQAIQGSQGAYERLGDNLSKLMTAILCSYKNTESSKEWLSKDMREILEDLTHTLGMIYLFVQSHISRNKATRVIFSRADAKKINEYCEHLNFAMQQFELQSHMNINNLLMQVVRKNEQLSEQISHRNEEDSRESVERQARDREIAKTLYGGEVKELLERPKDDQLPERILHQNEEDAQEIIEREARDREMAENFHQEELQAVERRKKDDILEQIQERRNTLKSIELQARDRGIAETLYGGEVKELLERSKDDQLPEKLLHQNEEDVRESIEREARDRELAAKIHQEELQAQERRKKDDILEQIQERRNTLKSIELQARDREIAETLYGGEVKELLLERPKDNQLPQQILHQNEEDARETIEREARDREMAEKFHQEELQALERRKKDHIELEARDREIAEKLHQEEVNELEGENTLLADEPWYSDESKEDGTTKTIWKSEVEQLRADVSKMKAARRKSGGGEDDRKAMIQAQATNRKWNEVEEQEEEKEGKEWPVSRSSEFKRNLSKADNSMEDDDEYLPNSKGPKTRGKVSRTTLLPIEPETEDEVTDDTEDHRPIPLRTQANRKPTSYATGSKYDIQPPRRQSEVELLRADVSKMEAARRKIGGDDRRATIQAQANNFKWNEVEEQEGKELSVKRSSKSKRSSLKADDDESSTGPKTRGKVSRTVEPETEDEITDDREDHRPTLLKTKANRKSQGSTSSATGSKSDIRSPRDAYSGVGVPWVINSGVGNTTNSTISNAGNNNSRVYHIRRTY